MTKHFFNLIVMAVIGAASVLVSCTKDDNGGAEKEIPVYMVTLNGTAVDLAFNYQDQVQLVAVVSPSNVKVKDVDWTTSDATVVSVSGGLLTGLKQGSAVITATSKGDPTKKATCNVTVKFKDVLLEGISFTFTGDEYEVNAGETADLSKLLKIDPATTTNNSFEWTSSVPKLASIDKSTGLLTANLPGVVTVDVVAKETHNFMGKDSLFVYTASLKVNVKGKGDLVYAYTAADFEKCTMAGFTLGQYAYFYSDKEEILIEDFLGVGKVINTNMRTAWGDCIVRVKLPVNKTMLSNRIEVDFLCPDAMKNDGSHEMRTQFNSQNMTVRGTNIMGQKPTNPAPNIVYVQGAESAGTHNDVNYLKVTGSVNLATVNNYELYKDDDTSDLILEFWITWWDMGEGVLTDETAGPVLISGIRFYLD